MGSQHVRVSKFLSYVLRHKPEAIGLQLEEGGWAVIDDLITLAAQHGKRLNRKIVEEVVASNDKQRFALSDDGTRIRASQGHSIPVDLGLQPVAPPQTLYHGTASRFLESILEHGLQPRGRQHVHLSRDHETAVKVGQRHGKPVVLAVAAGAMAADGHTFFLSANGVWLTGTVPPQYLSIDQG
jgi:putative RNA 2'-phosphotransferase